MAPASVRTAISVPALLKVTERTSDSSGRLSALSFVRWSPRNIGHT